MKNHFFFFVKVMLLERPSLATSVVFNDFEQLFLKLNKIRGNPNRKRRKENKNVWKYYFLQCLSVRLNDSFRLGVQ